MTGAPEGFRGTAFNGATASENAIHADDVAARYGFEGGLVPGVTAHAYLAQPAVAAWGLAFLERGRAEVVLRRPLYDGRPFEVTVKHDGARAYEAELRSGDGPPCATSRVSLPATPPAPPALRGDPAAPPRERRPPATPGTLEALARTGLGALTIRWDEACELDRSHRHLDDMPDLVRLDRGGFAHPGFSLGIGNWVLAANVRLGPWIHVESDVQHHAAIPRHATLVAESRIDDLFERGGHRFVDLSVAAYLAPATPALAIRHRAIYQLRESAA